MPWWSWVLLGVLALAGESVSMALFLLNVAFAAFVAAALSVLGVPALAQVGVFIVVAVLLIGLVRPRLLQALTGGRVARRDLTNQGMLMDRIATVTQTVTADSGAIRVGSGEFWTARTVPPVRHLDVGDRVRIHYVDGLTAYVEPLNVPADPIVPESMPVEAPHVSGASPVDDVVADEVAR